MASLKVQWDFGYQAAVAGASGVSAARSCAQSIPRQLGWPVSDSKDVRSLRE